MLLKVILFENFYGNFSWAAWFVLYQNKVFTFLKKGFICNIRAMQFYLLDYAI